MRRKVMISSSLDEMADLRSKLERRLRQTGFEPIVCENEPPSGSESPKERSLKLVDRCDIFVSIVGCRYGTIPSNDSHSYMEIEFDAACDHEKQIEMFVFIQEQRSAQRELAESLNFQDATEQFRMRNEFVGRIENQKARKVTFSTYETEDELLLNIVTSLGSTANQRRELRAAHSYDLLKSALCGREEEQGKLDAWFHNDNDYQPICMIEALGGMGKSALAWTWWQDVYRKDSTIAGAFWYSFYDEDASYEDFVRRLSAYIENIDETLDDTTLEQCLETCLDALKHQKILIALDGFESTYQRYSHTTKQPDASAIEDLGVRGIDYRTRVEFQSFRRIGDTRMSAFLNFFCKAHHVPSRVLITTRYIPVDLEQENGAPIACLNEIILDRFSFESTKEFWRERGLDANDPDLKRLYEDTIEGWPLALAVVSGSLSPGQLLSDFYRRHPDFDPLREGSTKAQRLSDIFTVALMELNRTEERILQAIAAFRFPLMRETLTALLSPLEPSDVEDDFDNIVDKAIRKLEDRKLIGYECGRLTMHPVVRHAVRSRSDDESARDIIGTAQAVPVPAKPMSISELELHMGLTSLLAERDDLVKAMYLFGIKLRPHLRRLAASREQFELCNLFFRIAENDREIEVEWLPNCERSVFEWLAAQTDFAQTLAHAYEDIGQPDVAVALHRKHSEVGLCRDPMCDMAQQDALKALGRLTEAEQLVFRCVGQTRRARRGERLDDAIKDLRMRLDRSNYREEMERFAGRVYQASPTAFYRMLEEICDHNIRVGRPLASIGYLIGLDDLVRRHGIGIRNVLYGVDDYLISRNLRVACILRDCGFAEHALDIVKQCLKQAVHDGSVARQRESYMTMASTFARLGQFTDAIDSITKYQDLVPEERGTIRSANALVILAGYYAEARNHNVARRLIDDARGLAESGSDRRILGEARYVEARIARADDHEDLERDLLTRCLEEFSVPSQDPTPMLFETQRLAVKRLRSCGSLSTSQSSMIQRLRAPMSFRPRFGRLQDAYSYAVSRWRPPVGALWHL